MIRGLYISASSLAVRQAQQENLSNNIANLNTPGYKKTNVLLKTFQEELISRKEVNIGQPTKNTVIGRLNYGVGVDGTKTDFSQGNINITGRDTDFALTKNDCAFSLVDDNGQVYYTRDGRFEVSTGGFLVDSQGMRVIGSNGQPIRLTSNEAQLNGDGILTNSIGNVGFMLSEIDTETGNITGRYNDSSVVKQGALEGSNMDVVDVMTELITISRSYESSQRVFQQLDETLSKTVNEVGTVR